MPALGKASAIAAAAGWNESFDRTTIIQHPNLTALPQPNEWLQGALLMRRDFQVEQGLSGYAIVAPPGDGTTAKRIALLADDTQKVTIPAADTPIASTLPERKVINSDTLSRSWQLVVPGLCIRREGESPIGPSVVLRTPNNEFMTVFVTSLDVTSKELRYTTTTGVSGSMHLLRFLRALDLSRTGARNFEWGLRLHVKHSQ